MHPVLDLRSLMGRGPPEILIRIRMNINYHMLQTALSTLNLYNHDILDVTAVVVAQFGCTKESHMKVEETKKCVSGSWLTNRRVSDLLCHVADAMALY